MGNGLKQRIAGTIVLTALGLTLLPLMIDFADPEKIDRTSKIPLPPSLEVENIVKATKPEQVGSKNNLKSLFDTLLSSPATDGSTGPGLHQDGLPKAWIVQVASFVDEVKADQLRSALIEKQFKAFSKKVKIDGRDHYRVYIGPKLQKNSALETKKNVDSQFNTDAIVLNYVP